MYFNLHVLNGLGLKCDEFKKTFNHFKLILVFLKEQKKY